MQEKKGQKSLRILIIHCDWLNVFRDAFHELYNKMNRDRLYPDNNSFFFFSWAFEDYADSRDNRYFTKHVKTRWRFFRPFIDFLTFFKVLPAVRASGFVPDLVVVYDFAFLPAARRVGKEYNIPVVLLLNNMPAIFSSTRSWGWLKSVYSSIVERLFVHIPDAFYVVGEALREYLEKMGAQREKIFVFSMDTIKRELPSYEKAQQGVIRNKYNLTPDQKVFLYVARLEAEKDHPRAFRLFSALPGNNVLFCLGRGSLLEEFGRLVRELGIEDRVFFPGFIRRDEIWNYFKDADILVLLSKAEGVPSVVWEAMYAGVPVIGSDIPGIVETLGSDGDRGFIMKKEDGIEAFTEKVNRALTKDSERTALVNRAQKFIYRQIDNKTDITTVFRALTKTR